ncbi:MAG: mevalonate kinase [Candidatus Micrarchaeia archaeon]
MQAIAPAVIKLLGEHAVVYGKFALAAAISIYARANAYYTSDNGFEIKLPDLGVDERIGKDRLERLYRSYRAGSDFKEFVSLNKDINSNALPYATILARLTCEYKCVAEGVSVELNSDIPIQKGFASSAACSVAFTLAVAKTCMPNMPEKELIDVARDGDRVIHKNAEAGLIDVNTSFYGGILSYSKGSGTNTEHISVDFDLYVVDTGPKKSTAETVGHVAELYRLRRKETEHLLDNIDQCSRLGLERLKGGDLKGFGEVMYKNQELLKQLGVSSEGLDATVAYAKELGILGAKLSGGGGGGIAVLLAERNGSTDRFKSLGFDVKKVSIDYSGAKGRINE